MGERQITQRPCMGDASKPHACSGVAFSSVTPPQHAGWPTPRRGVETWRAETSGESFPPPRLRNAARRDDGGVGTVGTVVVIVGMLWPYRTPIEGAWTSDRKLRP